MINTCLVNLSNTVYKTLCTITSTGLQLIKVYFNFHIYNLVIKIYINYYSKQNKFDSNVQFSSN